MVTHQTSPVTLAFDDDHQEEINLLLYESVHHTLTPGFPWLLKHNPHINRARTLLNTYFYCSRVSLRSLLIGVPDCYWDLK